MARLQDLQAWGRRWARRGVTGAGIRFLEGPDLGDAVEALAASRGGRAGLDAVLTGLDRVATPVDPPPARAASYAFRWDDRDFTDPQWWPQGVTTSADASDTDDIAGRRIVVVAWYAKAVRALSRGTRLTFVDVTDPESPRYAHVSLVRPVRRWWSRRVATAPVRVHAGGIVWYGPSILVADTTGGIRTFILDDLLPSRHRGAELTDFVLPQRTSYKAVNDRGFDPFRFSFVSIDRTDGSGPSLIAGEYGLENRRNRLIRFRFDAGRAALAMEQGEARPLEIVADGLAHMQGAALVRGTYYISTSRGGSKPGTLWVRRPGGDTEPHQGVLAVGPEDLTYWPQRDSLWSCCEYPGKRYVYEMPLRRFRPAPPVATAPA